MKRESLPDQLRRAMRESGLNYSELSRLTGIPVSTLSRFARGLTNTGTMATADKLVEALGLELRKTRKGKR